jgi:hypothetical protein
MNILKKILNKLSFGKLFPTIKKTKEQLVDVLSSRSKYPRRKDKIENWRIHNSLEISIKEWDKNDWKTERSEIQLKDKLEMWTIYKTSFDFLIPADFPIVDNRLVLAQRKQVAKDRVNQNPLLAVRFRDGKFWVTKNISGDIEWGKGNEMLWNQIDAKEIMWKRNHIEFDTKFSEKEDGLVKVTLNWKVIGTYEGRFSSSNETYPRGKYYDDKFYFKLGLYRDNYQKRIAELQKSDDTEKEQKIETLKRAIEQEKKNGGMSILYKNYNMEHLWFNTKATVMNQTTDSKQAA